MKEVIKAVPKLTKLESKKKVAAYARVSNGKDAMLHSLSSQVSYYSELIQTNNDWLFVGVYVDEAFTGTKEERPEFQQMLKDAKAGKIDLIITKSISRFARNTVTLLSTVRELKDIGVDVYFEEQNIHSLSSDGELMLSILASYAQEESRQVSENLKWRIKRNFEEGIPWGFVVYGYRFANNKIEVVLIEAEVVRLVYTWFLSGMGVGIIRKNLNKAGYTKRNDQEWSDSSVRQTLKNYYYTGNLILQKTFRDNHITKKTKINRGEFPKYHVTDSHEAIVSKNIFDKVQNEFKRRQQKINAKRKPSHHPFTGLIKCDNCGKSYRRKTTPYKHIWNCANYLTNGKEVCDAKQIPEEILYEEVKKIIGLEVFNTQLFKKKVKSIIAKNGNVIEFIMKDEKKITTTWKYRSRSESWTDEKREQARQRNLMKRGIKE